MYHHGQPFYPSAVIWAPVYVFQAISSEVRYFRAVNTRLHTFIRTSFWELRGHLIQPWARMYGASIQDNVASLQDCLRFLECIKIFITSRGGPNVSQCSCKSARKRWHFLFWLRVTAPHGFIIFIYSSNVGKIHDITVYRQRCLNQKLQHNSIGSGTQNYVYGNSALAIRPWLQVSFKRTASSPEQVVLNTRMSCAHEPISGAIKPSNSDSVQWNDLKCWRLTKRPLQSCLKWLSCFGVYTYVLIFMAVVRLVSISTVNLQRLMNVLPRCNISGKTSWQGLRGRREFVCDLLVLLAVLYHWAKCAFHWL